MTNTWSTNLAKLNRWFGFFSLECNSKSSPEWWRHMVVTQWFIIIRLNKLRQEDAKIGRAHIVVYIFFALWTYLPKNFVNHFRKDIYVATSISCYVVPKIGEFISLVKLEQGQKNSAGEPQFWLTCRISAREISKEPSASPPSNDSCARINTQASQTRWLITHHFGHVCFHTVCREFLYELCAKI